VAAGGLDIKQLKFIKKSLTAGVSGCTSNDERSEVREGTGGGRERERMKERREREREREREKGERERGREREREREREMPDMSKKT